MFLHKQLLVLILNIWNIKLKTTKIIQLFIISNYKFGTHVIISKLNFLIIAGAEKFRAIALSHVRNSDGIFIVYDITNSESFYHVSYWISEIEKAIDKNVVIYLIGNKIDLENKRTVSYENGKEKALKENFNFFGEVSAKTNENIMEIYNQFYKEIFYKNKEKILEKREQNKKLFEKLQQDNKGKKCC